jgi:hypothetical protein
MRCSIAASWYYTDGNTDVKYGCLQMLDWLVSTYPIMRKSTVLSFPLQLVFPDLTVLISGLFISDRSALGSGHREVNLHSDSPQEVG